MYNPFKYINQPTKEVPPELKEKVMNDIAKAKLIMDLGSLVTYNIIDVIDIVTKSRKLE